MLRVRFSDSARRFISTRQPKHRRQISSKIENLLVDPLPVDSELLKGTNREFRRADVGEYRIIYRVEDDILHVADIGKRNDDQIYRRFRRR
jgi:mRNA interferase RelE/StbE